MDIRKKKSERRGMDALQEKHRLEEVETEDNPASPAAKRQKKSPADDLLCPLSFELPFEPVTAKDGQLYEKEEIEKYFKGKTGHQVKSPITNKMMGKELLPSPWIKNYIDKLVETGLITGDLAKNWKEKVQQKKYMEDLLKEAEDQ